MLRQALPSPLAHSPADPSSVEDAGRSRAEKADQPNGTIGSGNCRRSTGRSSLAGPPRRSIIRRTRFTRVSLPGASSAVLLQSENVEEAAMTRCQQP